MLVLLFTLVHAAFGTPVVVDATVPTDLALDGERVASLWRPGRIVLEVAPGPHTLTVVVDGEGSRHELTVPREGYVQATVGESGVTLGEAQLPEGSAGRKVELHGTGEVPLVIVVGGDRHRVNPGAVVALDVPLGGSRFEVRGTEGGMIYARGTLQLGAAPPDLPGSVVVQVGEGRFPHVAGPGARFLPSEG